MTRFVLRRLAAIALISLGIVFFCALGMKMTANARAGAGGFNPIRFVPEAAQASLSYLRGVFTGRVGYVWLGGGRGRTATPIASILVDTYVKSMGLLLVSMIVAGFVGVGTGVLAAYWEGTPLSLAFLTTTLLGISLPTFFTALLLQVAEIKWYQRTGVRLVPVGGFGWDAHLVLPALVLAARPLAQLARVTCVALSEVAHQDYVQTAHAKGLSRRQVWGNHVLPNAMVSILTALGVSVRFSLGSLPVVEYFFGWPGLGAMLLNAIQMRHTNLLITLALALGLTFMFTNLLLDLAYRVLDPRLRETVQVSSRD